jgi:hypothetical protein
LLSGKLYELYGVLIASILMIVGVYFFLSLIKQLMNSLNNPKKVFYVGFIVVNGIELYKNFPPVFIKIYFSGGNFFLAIR